MANQMLTRLQASTLEDYVNGGATEDMVFSSTPFLTYVESSGMIVRKAGGKLFRSNIRLARNENYQGFGPDDTWVIKPFRGYTRAEWEMKEHVIPASLSAQDQAYNDGDVSIFDIVKDVVDVTNKSLADELNYDLLLSDGTGDGSKRAHGMNFIIGDKDSLYPVVGDIDARQYPWWQSVVKRPAITYPKITRRDPSAAWTYGVETDLVQNPFTASTDVTWQPLTLSLIDEMVDTLKKYGPGPEVCVTTTEIQRTLIRLVKAEGILVWNQAGTSTDTLVGGHEHVMYRGVRFIVDQMCPDGTMFFINSESLKVRVHPEYWMKARPWQEPFDQATKYMAIFAWYQMYSIDRRHLGKIERVAHIV